MILDACFAPCPHLGCPILRERGYPDEIVEAIASHADYMNIARDTPLKKAIYACDELVGFVGACVKVRPTKKLADLPVESVVKKLKDKAFARSVDRSYVYGGAEAIGRPLVDHVGFLIEALMPAADEIGLLSDRPRLNADQAACSTRLDASTASPVRGL